VRSLLAADKLGSVETLDHVVDLSLRISRNVGLKLLNDVGASYLACSVELVDDLKS
jgi:hypothetical protein